MPQPGLWRPGRDQRRRRGARGSTASPRGFHPVHARTWSDRNPDANAIYATASGPTVIAARSRPTPRLTTRTLLSTPVDNNSVTARMVSELPLSSIVPSKPVPSAHLAPQDLRPVISDNPFVVARVGDTNTTADPLTAYAAVRRAHVVRGLRGTASTRLGRHRASVPMAWSSRLLATSRTAGARRWGSRPARDLCQRGDGWHAGLRPRRGRHTGADPVVRSHPAGSDQRLDGGVPRHRLRPREALPALLKFVGVRGPVRRAGRPPLPGAPPCGIDIGA